MSKQIIAWVVAAVAFLALDGLWLGFVAPNLNPKMIGEILSMKVEVAPAVAFYLIYITGLVILAIAPAMEKGGVRRAAMLGAVLGLVAYGTYDLTNQATLKVWDVRLTLADMAWGTFASAVASAISCAVAGRRKA